MLLLVVLAVVTVASISVHLYLRYFGLPKASGQLGQPGGLSVFQLNVRSEHSWMNDLVDWFYSRQTETPECLNAWLKALNDQVRNTNTNDEIHIRFSTAQRSYHLPCIKKIWTDKSGLGGIFQNGMSSIFSAAPSTTIAPMRDELNIYADILWADVVLMVSAINRSSLNVQSVNSDFHIQKLQGQLKATVYRRDGGIIFRIAFNRDPVIKCYFERSNLTQNEVIQRTLEAVMIHAIAKAETIIHVPVLMAAMGTMGTTTQMNRYGEDKIQPMNVSTVSAAPRLQVQQKKTLNVKIVKASGLATQAGRSDTYCVIRLDHPEQRHATSSVKNTSNPYFDESFVLDTSDYTKQLIFELYDKDNFFEGGFIGQSIIDVADIPRFGTARQLLPLTGRSSSSVTIQGSLNIEISVTVQDVRTMANPLQHSFSIGDSSTSYNYPPQQPYGTISRASQDMSNQANPQSVRASRDLSDQKQGAASQPHPDSSTMTTSSVSSTPKIGPRRRTFANAIKKRFARKKPPRSHSADRAFDQQQMSHDPYSQQRSGNLLKPQSDINYTISYQSTDNPNLRSSSISQNPTSNSNFLSVLGLKSRSRENSISKQSYQANISREGSTGHPSPQLSRGSQQQHVSPYGMTTQDNPTAFGYTNY